MGNYLDLHVTALRKVDLKPWEFKDGIKYMTLRQWIEYTKVLNPTVEAIRRLAPDLETKKKNKDQISALKVNLPAVVVSSLLNGLAESNIMQSIPLLSIDIDAQDNTWITDWQQFKHNFISYLNNGKNVVYCGLSVSGLGLWAVIALAYPSRINEQIEAVKRDFNRFSINGHFLKPDKQNLSQVAKRFLTYDPQPFINENAEPYQGIVVQEPPRQYTNNGKGGENLETILQRNNIQYSHRKSNDVRQMFAIQCPWCHLHSSHSKAETVVFQYYGGGYGFKCLHDHCADKHWPEFKKWLDKGIL